MMCSAIWPVDVKRQRRQLDHGAEVNVFSGAIRATMQADDAMGRVNLTPELVADLPSWVDRCAARIMHAAGGN